jgi:hypothetical protein
MGWPQITMIVLLGLGVARGMFKHGEDDGEVNFFASAIGAALTAWLLWAGGFWGAR